MKFISLHGHTSHSTGDGHKLPEDHVKRVKELGMTALAITEHGNTSSHVQLEKAAQKHGIKPIYGVEAYVAPPETKQKFHQTILAMTTKGYRQLNHLVTRSYEEGFFHYPTVHTDWLMDKEQTSDLIVLSGCADSWLSSTLAGGKSEGEKLVDNVSMEETKRQMTDEEYDDFTDALAERFQRAIELVNDYKEVFGTRFYLELQLFDNYPRTCYLNQKIIELHEITGVPLVVTADVHYPNPEDWEIQRLSNAISWGETVDSLAAKRDYEAGKAAYPLSDREVAERLLRTGVPRKYIRPAIENTQEIASRCNVKLPKTQPVRYSGSRNAIESVDLLKEKVKEGIKYRQETSEVFRNHFAANKEAYKAQLKKEFNVILPRAGFPDYFLVNWQVISWAKENGIAVGPARGCLTSDSKVLTKNGFVPIDKVEVGDSVWTHEGRWRDVEDTFEYSVNEDLVKISAFYGDQGVTLTKDHKILVKKCERVTNKQKLAQGYRFMKHPQGDNVWVEAKDVEVDDLVMLPIPESQGLTRDTVDLAEFCEERDAVTDDYIIETRFDTGEETLVPRYVSVSDFVWMLGAFASNGWTRKDRDRREVGFATKASADDGEIVARFRDAFGMDLSLGAKGKADLHQYRIHSRTLRNLFESCVPGYQWKAQTKTLPSWVHDLTAEQKRSLINGLWWGDGSSKPGQKTTYSTTSEELSAHVRLLLWAIGAPAGVAKTVRFDRREEFFGEHIEFKVTTTRGFAAPRGQNGYRDDKYIYMRVRDIEEVKGVDKVYDIQVAQDHSFMTDSFVVHNSAGSSLVCYLLRITEINPMEFPQMVFERFLDPGREDEPDIDTDYPDDRRNEVFEFARREYGEANVGNIGNFSRYRGKMAVKSAGKALRVPIQETNRFADLIGTPPFGDPREFDSAEDAAGAFEDARKVVQEYPDLKLAYRLEGDMKTLGIHAAGMVISNTPIADTCAIYKRVKSNGESAEVIAYDKRDASYLQMLKLDCLGLKTMTIVADVIDMVPELSLEKLYELPRDDEKVLKAFGEDDLTGIFQFEGRSTRGIVKDIYLGKDKYPNFMQLADINALSRPGSLSSGMTRQYIAVENGAARKEIHPVVDEILAETNGCLVYQEQVMRIGKVFGGLDDSEVGRLRKIIGAKQAGGAFEAFWEKFKTGAMSNHGASEAKAREVWEYMAASSSYLFNVAHAIAYALVAYWTQYLKQYYPAEFYAASLRSAAKKGKTKDKADPQLLILQDAVEHGLTVNPPSAINSDVTWKPNTERTGVEAGFVQLPKVGEKTAIKMIEARESAHPASVDWEFYSKLKIGFGNTAVENAKEMQESDDPFGIHLTNNAITSVVNAIEDGEIPLNIPNATSATIAKQVGEHVTYLGHVVAVRIIDHIAEVRQRENLTHEEVLDKIKSPELATKAKVICADAGGTEVHVNISRFKYPQFEEELAEIDTKTSPFVIWAEGPANADFGPAVQANSLVAIEMEQ